MEDGEEWLLFRGNGTNRVCKDLVSAVRTVVERSGGGMEASSMPPRSASGPMVEWPDNDVRPQGESTAPNPHIQPAFKTHIRNGKLPDPLLQGSKPCKPRCWPAILPGCVSGYTPVPARDASMIFRSVRSYSFDHPACCRQLICVICRFERTFGQGDTGYVGRST